MVGFYAEMDCMILLCRKALRFSDLREINLFRGGLSAKRGVLRKIARFKHVS